MTAQLTKAGLDPSRIVERAAVISGKRKRDDEDVDMEDGEADAEGWMDVDGEEGGAAKRLKTNSGAVTKREPRGNRALAGMRDQGVRALLSPFAFLELYNSYAYFTSKQTGPSSYGISASGRGTCLPGPARETAQSKPKWCVTLLLFGVLLLTSIVQPKHLFAGKRKGGKTQRR
jgi:hypothetical protein